MKINLKFIFQKGTNNRLSFLINSYQFRVFLAMFFWLNNAFELWYFLLKKGHQIAFFEQRNHIFTMVFYDVLNAFNFQVFLLKNMIKCHAHQFITTQPKIGHFGFRFTRFLYGIYHIRILSHITCIGRNLNSDIILKEVIMRLCLYDIRFFFVFIKLLTALFKCLPSIWFYRFLNLI